MFQLNFNQWFTAQEAAQQIAPWIEVDALYEGDIVTHVNEPTARGKLVAVNTVEYFDAQTIDSLSEFAGVPMIGIVVWDEDCTWDYYAPHVLRLIARGE